MRYQVRTATGDLVPLSTIATLSQTVPLVTGDSVNVYGMIDAGQPSGRCRGCPRSGEIVEPGLAPLFAGRSGLQAVCRQQPRKGKAVVFGRPARESFRRPLGVPADRWTALATEPGQQRQSISNTLVVQTGLGTLPRPLGDERRGQIECLACESCHAQAFDVGNGLVGRFGNVGMPQELQRERRRHGIRHETSELQERGQETPAKPAH